MKTSIPRLRQGLFFGLSLGLMLLVVSYTRTVVNAGSMMFHDQMMDTMFAGPIWGSALGYNLAYFALAVVLIHLLFGMACWALGHLSVRAWPSEKITLRQHLLLWFIALTVGLLTNNAAMFVSSSLGEPYSEVMSMNTLGLRLGRLIWFCVLASAAVTALMAGVRWWRGGGRLARRGYMALTAAGVAYFAVSAHSILPPPAPAPSAKPNVILIGLDSLRADLFDPKISPGVTPNIAAFMKSGARFSNAMTPLARTFPSMCSMLTGRRPHHSGAVMNLLPRNLIDDSESLPRVLARNGYQTAYVTDEVRFSNIDTSYGFAQSITPPIGASDFLIAKISDAPLSNLLMNTFLGSWLFPHVYANRGAAITYDPDTFVVRIDRELEVSQPLLLNVHLTLSHWPYRWAGAPIKKSEPEARWPSYYLRAAQRVDQQFADILDLLEERRLLENALVVVYSDHGESFESPNEALVPDGDPLIEALHINPTWGHGTSVLTAHQYRIVLGMRRYGGNWQAGREFAVPVSFEDVTPTIVEALAAKTSARFDGRSLLPLLEGHADAEHSFAGRIRFTETEYNPRGLQMLGDGFTTSTMQEAMSIYLVDSVTDRITVKPERLGLLLAGRQYAAVGDQHVVGAFPSVGGSGFEYLALAREGGEPRQLHSEPAADEPELRALWIALHAEFDDILQAPPQTVANHERTIPQGVTK